MRTILPIGSFTMVAVILAVTATGADARTSYQTTFNDLYAVAGTRLDDCGVCHLDFRGGGPGNAYYGDWVAAGGPGNPVIAYMAVANLDSDGDGVANLAEILALFHPGYSCDTYADASNAPADLADYVSLDDIGCSPPPQPRIEVSPLAADLGLVEVGASASQTVTVRNLGDANLTVTAATLSAGTEYSLSGPTAPVAIGPGGEVQWMIAYAPMDEGLDAGIFSVGGDDPNTPSVSVEISGLGFLSVSNSLDLDIAKLQVTKRVRVEHNPTVKIVASIENIGKTGGETRPATLSGMQNGELVYSETQEVYDEVGRGRTRFVFGPYVASSAGNLEWTLEVADDDPDLDIAMATTLVISSTSMAGADLAGADLSGEILTGVDFTGADARGADFREADLSHATGLAKMLSDASTQYSSKTSFTSTEFDPAQAGWILMESSAVPIGSSFGWVKALFGAH